MRAAGLGGLILLVLSFSAGAFGQSELIDLNALDRTVSPCEDFYQYACGNWIKQTSLPAGYSVFSRGYTSLQLKNTDILHTVLEKYAAGQTDPKVPFSAQMGAYYAACTDESVAVQDTRGLPQKLAAIDSVTDRAQIPSLLGTLIDQGVDAFVRLSVDQDPHDAAGEMLQLDAGGLGLGQKDYYLNTDAQSRKLLGQYQEHIAKMLVLSGLSETEAALRAGDVLALEKALAAPRLSLAEKRDPHRVDNPMTFADLTSRASGFDWASLFAAAGIPQGRKQNVVDTAYIGQLGAIFQATPLETLKAYLRWSYLNLVASSLSKPFVDENFYFFGEQLMGKTSQLPRWKKCVNAVSDAMPHALGMAYVTASFNQDARDRASIMVDEIHESLREDLESVAWLDSSTRQAALKKLSMMTKKIGYTTDIPDYSDIQVSRSSYLDSLLSANTAAAARGYRKIERGTDRAEWLMPAHEANAYYNPGTNDIAFPAAILQFPFFLADAPLAQDYGAIGRSMGHESTHGFDDQGSQYDGNGNLQNWWAPEVRTRFEQKARCIRDQYGAYTVGAGVHLNGQQTLGENIADNGGLKLAHLAWQRVEKNGSSTPPLGGLTPEQQFFLGFAQSWCSVVTPKYETWLAINDVHSPPRYRVIGAVSNNRDFARAFSCPIGSKMAPTDACSVW